MARAPSFQTRGLTDHTDDFSYPTITLKMTSDAKNGGPVWVTVAGTASDSQAAADAAWIASGVSSRINDDLEFYRSRDNELAMTGDEGFVHNLARRHGIDVARSLSKAYEYVQLDIGAVTEGRLETVSAGLPPPRASTEESPRLRYKFDLTRTETKISVIPDDQNDAVAKWVAEGVERRLNDDYINRTDFALDSHAGQVRRGECDESIRDHALEHGPEIVRSISRKYVDAKPEVEVGFVNEEQISRRHREVPETSDIGGWLGW